MRLSPINGLFNAPVMKAYLPRIRRRNDPLIPGRIIAQMAIDPEKKRYKGVLGVSTGISETILTPTIIPKITETIFFGSLR
jgi:hypothetical protein